MVVRKAVREEECLREVEQEVAGMATGLLNICNSLMQNYEALTITKPNTSADITVKLSNIILKAGLSYTMKHLYNSKDNILDSYNKDYLRKTMLRHEEIFRDQLNELHRLYHVQRTMMTEIRNEMQRFQSASIVNSRLLAGTKEITHRSGSSSETCSSSPLDYMNHLTSQLNIKQAHLRDGKRGDPQIKRAVRDFDLEEPAEEYAPTEVRNTCKGTRIFGKQLKENLITNCPQKCSENESGLELTLSLGRRSEKGISSHQLHP